MILHESCSKRKTTPPAALTADLGLYGYGPGYGPPVRSDAPHVVRVADWLRANPPARPVSSYYLKHQIENALRTYTANGEAILAALAVGLDVVRIPRTPNAMIGPGRRKAVRP